MAHDFGYRHVQAAYSRFTRIFLDDDLQHLIRYRDMLRLDAVVLHLLRNQVSFRDFPFLFQQIAAHFDNLHTVAQRGGNRAQIVRRGDEHHLRQVIIHLQEIVMERIILFRVEHLQQSRLGVSAEIIAHLVYFVQDEHRIRGSCFFDVLQYPSRHGADIRLAVSADFRLIMQSS